MAKFDPYGINTPQLITKKFVTGNPHACAKFGANPFMGASGEMGKIQLKFSYLFQ